MEDGTPLLISNVHLPHQDKTLASLRWRVIFHHGRVHSVMTEDSEYSFEGEKMRRLDAEGGLLIPS